MLYKSTVVVHNKKSQNHNGPHGLKKNGRNYAFCSHLVYVGFSLGVSAKRGLQIKTTYRNTIEITTYSTWRDGCNNFKVLLTAD